MKVASGRARGGGVDFRSLGLMLVADFGIAAAFSAARSSCRRSSPLAPNETGEIVGEVGHTDLGSGAGDADGAGRTDPSGDFCCAKTCSTKARIFERRPLARDVTSLIGWPFGFF